MKNKFTDVDFKEVKPKIYYTIPQIAKIIGEDPNTTRYWGNEYGEDCLFVEIVNGRRKFSEESVERFKQIKVLIKEHKFSKPQVIKYFQEMDVKRGEKYKDYKNATELIDPQDPLGMTVLASQLTIKMEKYISQELSKFLENLQEDYEKHLKEVENSIKTSITNEIIEETNNNINNLKEEIKNEQEKNSESIIQILDTNIIAIKEMKESHEKDIEMIQKLRNDLEIKKDLQEQNQTTNKNNRFSFITKLFNKNK